MMVQQVTVLSRNFIAANNFKILLSKFALKTKGLAFRKLYVKEDKDLKRQLEQKTEDLGRMEQMFKEYATWRQKLEMIEAKMKQEVEYWKNQAQKSQLENEKIQKELLQLSKE